MQLKIGNMLAMAIALGTLWLFFQFQPAIFHTFQCIAHIGPGNPPAIRLEGCIGLAVVTLGVVSVAKLLAEELCVQLVAKSSHVPKRRPH